MGDKLALHLFALSVALHTAACGHVFLHESSAILVKLDGTTNHADSNFGFAMGFWNKSLIISAPTYDLIGKVYSCPLEGIPSNSLSCSDLDLFNSTTYLREINPNQNYHLGASIATTKDYLFTCAPLVTKNITRSDDKFTADSIGSCFIYSNETSIEYEGPEVKYVRGESIAERIEGGTGWTTFADEENGLLLVAKTSVYGDVIYLKISNPTEIPEILTNDDMDMLKDDIIDVGYGITTGKFFSNERVPVYAVSKQTKSMTGQIMFLKEVDESDEDKILELMDDIIEHDVVGAMFGYALAAADLTGDGLSELLVGAPLQSEDINEVEFGAMHIYLGGDIAALNNENRIRTIFGAKSMGRFGTTIATNDIDGDSIAEVFVSAPFEDTGVVYILSGYELNVKLLRDSSPLVILVSKLQNSQKVVRKELDWFGFSLLTVPDVDGNGCNELAIGAPAAASALLLRCLQTINVTVTSELMGLSVREKDTNFTVKVCLDIGYSKNATNISGNIIVNNYIDGKAEILEPSFKLNLSDKKEKHCEDIVVNLTRHEMYDYEMRTKLELENYKKSAPYDFDSSWVQLSIYSKMESNLTILRRCSGDNCNPQLSLIIKWSDKEYLGRYKTKATPKSLWYKVESSKEETVSIVVKNKGYEASEACVWVEITGAPVYKPGKCYPHPSENPKGYECALPISFRRNDKITFDIFLNMSRLSNKDQALVITAQPYENCFQKVSNYSQGGNLTINYYFKEAWEKVVVEGTKQDLSISDLEIKKDKKESKQETYKIEQQYKITNMGSVAWESVVVIEVENRPFITKFGATDCSVLKGENDYHIRCPIFLSGDSTRTVIAWMELARTGVVENIKGGWQTNVTSQMKLYMDPRLDGVEYIQKSLISDIILNNDISFKNNQMLIGLVAAVLALLLLALVTYCLCKNGFFKREKKKKLGVLKESVRRRSIRLASEKSSRYSQKSPSNVDDDINGIDIEVISDSPFEELPIGSKDDAVLIEAKADIHGENAKKGRKGDTD